MIHDPFTASQNLLSWFEINDTDTNGDSDMTCCRSLCLYFCNALKVRIAQSSQDIIPGNLAWPLEIPEEFKDNPWFKVLTMREQEAAIDGSVLQSIFVGDVSDRLVDVDK